MKFEKQLYKELQTWQENEIISSEQAEQIKLLHPYNKRADYNIMLIIFSVIGALLIGGGIILIFGRNWDELPIFMRTFIAFIPLVISQGITAFLLFKKIKSDAWREGVGLFYAISVYACIALIGQIYQLPGSFEGYLLVCSLLVLPVCYVLKATIPMLIYIIGITVWTASSYYSGTTDYSITYFLGLIVLAIPHIYLRFKENLYGAYSQLILWCLVICGFVISVTKLPFSDQHFIVISLYFSMLYLISVRWFDSEKPILLQPLKVVGFVGSMVMLIIMSNDFCRYFFHTMEFNLTELPQIVVSAAMAAFSLYLIVRAVNIKNPLKSAQTVLIGAVFLAALAMKKIMPSYNYTSYYSSDIPQMDIYYILMNVYMLIIGVLLIINGLKEARFSSACLGTVLISYVVIVRFFDTSYDFFTRGLVFIVVGTLFLLSNVFISKKIKREAQKSVENN